MAVTPWPQPRIDDFVEWHEQRIQQNGYGPAVVAELRAARDKFIVAVVPKQPT